MKLEKGNQGFTLTELIVVIVIIGILAAVLIPSITGYVNKAKQSVAEQEANSIYEVYSTYKTELLVQSYVGDFSDYYQEITGQTLPNWTVNSDSTVKVNGKDYSFKFTHSNGYNVYLSNDGTLVECSK